MNTPTIIAARNEAQQIGRTLDVLSRQDRSVEPIVVVNGSTDRTADIARNSGAIVLESAEGKMPALQEGLRYLGSRALEPVLILDADSRPFLRKWSGRMSDELENSPKQAPALVWGPYIFSDEINPALGAFFSATSMYVSWADRHKDNPRTIRGGNMGLFMRKDELLEEILALDNYWPRDDVAIFDSMKNHDANHKVIFRPEGCVLTSGFRTMDTIRQIVKNRKHPSKVMDDSYASDAPEGSKPYFSNTTDTVIHDKP
ncbi:glycosyltransferase family 2 protein [Candidatus Saccharibacteria bacterium]|nr:glycosyltransferase family 2 protein [Candidatus Saccharibacteria bacterium]